MDAIPNTDLLTTKDVADLLRLKPRAVQRLVKRGKLPVIRIGEKTLRFDPAELDRVITQRSQEKAKVSA
jgi:excisionase family DNA binding protein